jgi:hypothetical protein
VAVVVVAVVVVMVVVVMVVAEMAAVMEEGSFQKRLIWLNLVKKGSHVVFSRAA